MVHVKTLEELEKALRKLGITPKTHYVIMDYKALYIVSMSDKDCRMITIEPQNKHEKTIIPRFLLKKGFKIILDIYPAS